MTPAGAGPLCTGEGRTILAGRCDCVGILGMAGADWEEEARDQSEGQQEFAHQYCSYKRSWPSISILIFDIREGEISVVQAKERYALSDEELAAWIRDYDARGLSGLKVYDLGRRLAGGVSDRPRRNYH
jgi:Protein of unknown function (DUF1153)